MDNEFNLNMLVDFKLCVALIPSEYFKINKHESEMPLISIGDNMKLPKRIHMFITENDLSDYMRENNMIEMSDIDSDGNEIQVWVNPKDNTKKYMVSKCLLKKNLLN